MYIITDRDCCKIKIKFKEDCLAIITTLYLYIYNLYVTGEKREDAQYRPSTRHTTSKKKRDGCLQAIKG